MTKDITVFMVMIDPEQSQYIELLELLNNKTDGNYLKLFLNKDEAIDFAKEVITVYCKEVHGHNPLRMSIAIANEIALIEQFGESFTSVVCIKEQTITITL